MIAELSLSAQRALFGAACIACGLVLVPPAIALARRFFPGRNVFFARWGFSHVVLVFAIALVSGVAMNALAARAPGEIATAVAQRIGALVALAIACMVVFQLASRRDPKGIACLGLWPGGHLRAMALGVACYVAALPVLFGAGLVSPWLVELLGSRYEPQRAAIDLVSLSGRDFWIAAVCAGIAQPFFEEILFRSFLQPLLVQNLGDRGGVIVTSLVFALLHGSAGVFLPIFALSLLLGMLMLRTQRLSASWLVHSLHNSAVIALLSSVPSSRELLGQSGLVRWLAP